MSLPPERLLRDWVGEGLPFRRTPRLVGALDGGRTNRNFLLEADGARWVLRIGNPHAAALGIDRYRELALLRAAAEAGLAPRPLWADPARGLLLSRHVDGERVSPAELNPARRGALLALLAAVRELTGADADFDYGACLRAYRAPDDEPSSELVDCLAGLDAARARGVCHHDPGPWNVIFAGGRPWLLDWEFAARGLPVLDLAAVVVDWQQPAAQVARLAGAEPGQLDLACVFYRGLCRLWERRLAALGGPDGRASGASTGLDAV